MEYKKKMKLRLLVDLFWAVLGLGMIFYYFLTDTINTYPFSLGIAFICIGIIRTIQYRQTVTDEKALREKELEEKDERNRMISERAKSWAFSFSVFVAGILMIILSLLGYHKQSQPLAWFVCGMTALYWIFWNILRKKY